jgi:hypothetical protein
MYYDDDAPFYSDAEIEQADLEFAADYGGAFDGFAVSSDADPGL